MIAEMAKLRLIAVASDEEGLLAALHKTCSVELVEAKPLEGTQKVNILCEDYAQKREKLLSALSLLFKKYNRLAKEKGKKPLTEAVCEVKYEEFLAALELEDEVFPIVDKIIELNSEYISVKAEIAKLKVENNKYLPYLKLSKPFSYYKDTAFTRLFLGSISYSAIEEFKTLTEKFPLSETEIIDSSGKAPVISAICHTDCSAELEKELLKFGFVRCPFFGNETAKDLITANNSRIAALTARLDDIDNEIFAFGDSYLSLRILADRYAFELEIASSESAFLRTKATFYLEAFVPLEAKEKVEKAIKESSPSAFSSFTEVSRKEFAPTLMKNKNLTKQFEFVTNLYSPPSYGSIDHNFIMMLFFSVFMGFIMADIGYGLIMAVGGFIFAKVKFKRDTGSRRLIYVIAVGGVMTIIFGVLFDSFFGYGLLRSLNLIDKPFMPDPIVDKSSLAGISIPTLLLISLGMGVVQIMVSLVLKAVQEFSRKNYLAAFSQGICWVMFLAGLLVAVIGMVALPSITTIGLILAIVGVALGTVTAAFGQKGFSIVSKPFGAVYGIINYFSDILSYARLYGLMLSGAQIAVIVTDLSMGLPLPMMILVLIIGHAFNLAMGILGAFIHDARLQYIEFFSRFYEGEGELFTPFATKFENVYLVK